MKLYESYRDSGIEWLGQIPSHWEIIHFKRMHSGTNVGESIDKLYWTDEEDDLLFYTAGVKPIHTCYPYFPKEKLTKKEDLLLSRNGTPYVYLPFPKAAYTDHVIRVSILPDINKRYIYYALTISINNEVVDTVSLPTWSASIWNSQKLPVPPLSEQTQIVEYLDTNCGDIDKKIAVLEKEQKAYERLKVAVINRAVTEGLDPDTPKRDSGIDWLGMIPENWQVKRLKDFGYLYSGLTGKEGDDFRCDDESLTKPYVPFTNILNNTRVSKDLLHRVVISANEEQNKVLQGDLLFLMSSEDYDSIAKSSVVSEDIGEVYLNSFCRGFRPNTQEMVSEFVNYQLYATKYRDNLRFEARGFTRINIKIDRINSMTITLPPYSEQVEIVEYLDAKCADIDAKIANVAKRIYAYKRLKKALINEVVTGKRKVV